MKKILLTYILCYYWCFIWNFLEYHFEGKLTNRPVDNIMTIIAIPLMYFTVSYFLKK